MTKCPVCKERFKTHHGMLIHKYQKHVKHAKDATGLQPPESNTIKGYESLPDAPPNHQCQQCAKSFPTPRGLQVHIQKIHIKPKHRRSSTQNQPDYGQDHSQEDGDFQPHSHGPNFCPNCGFSLLMIQTALRVAEKMARRGQ